jgi:hypothetical protein
LDGITALIPRYVKTICITRNLTTCKLLIKRMRWAGHVARMGEKKGAYRIWCGDLREGDHLGDPGIDGRIILQCMFKKCDGGAWTGLS